MTTLGTVANLIEIGELLKRVDALEKVIESRQLSQTLNRT